MPALPMTSPAASPQKQMPPPDFADRLIAWQQKYGRHHLPWQTPDPYRVWVSEIMLQQTQVATVIGYYERFMARFPTLGTLADAPLDDVLAHWAGLGYYSRARNLHKTAKALQATITQTGIYPQTLDEWQTLAGIGRSTAGAIMALGLGKFGVICDGNVKRVLCRHFAIDGDTKKTATDRFLWQIATDLTPKEHSGQFAQAMMDLGATLCTRTRPNCPACPIQSTCQGWQLGDPTAYPKKSKKADKPHHNAYALLLYQKDSILMLKRQATGIWGGLWCLPMYSETKPQSDAEMALYTLFAKRLTLGASLCHTFTHFHWHITCAIAHLSADDIAQIQQLLHSYPTDFIWADGTTQKTLGKPAAISQLLATANTAFF